MNYKHPENTTKGEAAERLFPGQTYDCALPQSFIEACRQRGFDDVAGHFVMLYPKGSGIAGTEYIAPITEKGIEIAARIMTYSA